MSSDVDQLARSVEQVSLDCSSRKVSFRTPSLSGEDGDVASISSDGDVDMSEGPHSETDTPVAKDGTSEFENSSQPSSLPQQESLIHDVSTNTCRTSPFSLRRGGRPSLGLCEEFSNIFQCFLAPVVLFYVSHSPNFKTRNERIVHIIGKVAVVFVAITQVLRILRLCWKLCEPAYVGNRAMYKHATSKRRRTSRVGWISGEWDISTLDRVDNFVCKILVWLLLVVCRIGIILLCCAYLGFSTVMDNTLITAGMETLDFLVGIILDFRKNGVLNTNPDANVLQECKTIPRLVFEN